MNPWEELAEKNYKLVFFVVKSFHCPSVEKDDMIGAASLGLIKAARTFREDYGHTFSTYAVSVMRNEVLMLIRKEMYIKDNCESLDALSSEGRCIYDSLSSPTSLENQALARVALSMVADRCREAKGSRQEVIRLHLLGFSQMEIAHRVGVSQASVSRILADLKRQIKKIA